MEHEHDPKHPEQSVDTTRRRLAKAGLAAPAVLGVLASRPVLAIDNKFHHCTPSGHISGFASPNPIAEPCSSLGKTVSYYAMSKNNWPEGNTFLLPNGNSRNFKDAPAGLGDFHNMRMQFEDAYEFSGGSQGQIPTVWDVLKGCRVNENNGQCLGQATIKAKSGYNPDISLGQEAIAAAMNALAGYPNDFPISIQQVVEMFNIVVKGGFYQVTSTNQWNAAEVMAYWKSLHA